MNIEILRLLSFLHNFIKYFDVVCIIPSADVPAHSNDDKRG